MTSMAPLWTTKSGVSRWPCSNTTSPRANVSWVPISAPPRLSKRRAPLQRPLDPVGGEVERSAPLHLDRLARVMGEDEHVVVVRRVVSPPTLPLLIPPVPAAHGPEHVAAHHAGADVLERFLDDPCARVDLAALLVMLLAPGGQR